MTNNLWGNPYTTSAQAVFQPGFAGTDVQQVRNQIASEGGYQYGNSAYLTGAPTAHVSSFPAGVQSGAQAIFQPGFAGTDPAQVRNQFARSSNVGYGQAIQSTYTSPQFTNVPVGVAAAVPASVQAIFQPGFAGTDPQQVRSQFAGYGASAQAAPAAFNAYQSNNPVGVQAIFQPGFSGTSAQQVRSQIANDIGLGYGPVTQTVPAAYPGTAAYQSSLPVGVSSSVPGGVQAIFQPGFAGTDVQQVQNQIAREGGFGTVYHNQVPYATGLPAVL